MSVFERPSATGTSLLKGTTTLRSQKRRVAVAFGGCPNESLFDTSARGNPRNDERARLPDDFKRER
jgi:hypothetical protein